MSNADCDKPCLATWAALPAAGVGEVEALIDGVVESLVVHRDDSGTRAWLNICPHAGRRLDWSPGRFLLSKEGHLVCAAHGASFALPSGECVAGPCRGQSLTAVAIECDDDGIRLA